jgi:ABC-type branched-subunit amino acid transport system permease subunit
MENTDCFVTYVFIIFSFHNKKYPFTKNDDLIFIYAILGNAWNILGGLAGQVSLGHVAYFV